MRNRTRAVDLGRERVGEGGENVGVEITHEVLSFKFVLAIYKNRGAAALTMGVRAYVYFGALVGVAQIGQSLKH